MKRRSLRSARLAIVTSSLLLVAVPLAMLLVSWLYERVVVVQYQERLQQIAAQVARAPEVDLHDLGTREGVEILRLGSDGRLTGQSATAVEAMRRSTVGGWLEQVLERPLPSAFPARTPFGQMTEDLGPLAGREEVRAALAGEDRFTVHDSERHDAVLFTWAMPDGRGGAVVVMKGSVRGLRQLLFLRGELVKLLLAQVLFAGLIIFLLSRWLVRPLERLADTVRRYPSQEIAHPELLERLDEIGELARAIAGLTRSLEGKRQAAADLAADLAHELKNPLATVTASSELIASTQDPNPQKREMVHQHISEAVSRMQETTDQLLKLMRLDVALGEQAREEVSYHALLESVLGEYRRDPRYGGFQLTLDAAADLPPVRVVPGAWGALLRNLLDNALVQPMERREVVVWARAVDGRMVTEVRDHGPGISPGNMDKIFRRFFTQRPEGAAPGTGLGLSIVQTVAERHGGTVEAVSPPGAGATFRVTVPLS